MKNEGKYHNLTSLIQMADGDTEFEKILTSTFREEAPNMASTMKEAYEKGDMETMGRIAHSLKPNIELFGIVSVQDKILFVENCGKNGNAAPELAAILDEIEQVIVHVANELR